MRAYEPDAPTLCSRVRSAPTLSHEMPAARHRQSAASTLRTRRLPKGLVDVFINGRRVDHKSQYYEPHAINVNDAGTGTLAMWAGFTVPWSHDPPIALGGPHLCWTIGPW